MKPDIETTSYFNRVAAALDLSSEQRELAWSLMTKANVGRDDPTSVYFAILSKFEALSSSMGSDFERSGSALVADMRSSLSAEMQKQLAALPVSLSAKLDARMEEYIRQLAGGVDAAIQKEAARRQTFRLGGFALGVALLAVAAASGGVWYGRTLSTSDSLKWESVVNLEDGGRWLELARLNDLDKAMAQSCGPSGGRVIAGGKVCDLPLFVSAPVSTSKGADAVWLTVADWSNRLGWWGYALAGAVGFALARLVSRSRTA